MGFIRDLTGRTAVDAATNAADAQVVGGEEASALLDPFQQIGQQGLDQSGFLTDSAQQFDFLQNNPLFQLGLDNANQQTMQGAASRGRLSSGDTLQQLNNNALLAGQGLIGDQKNSIQNLLSTGLNVAGAQGNLRTGQAAAQAGGIVGAANARGARAQNVFDLGSQAAAAYFSDPKLKDEIKLISSRNGFNIYSWVWNEAAAKLGLFGASSGVMADEVKETNPDAITMEGEYMKVNYDMIGV